MEDWSTHKIPCKLSPTYLRNQELAGLKKTLAEQEATLGVDHQETLQSMEGIGRHLLDDGNLKEAEPYLRRSLEGCERTLGPDHRDTLKAVSDMGQLLREKGELDLVEPFFHRFLEASERVNGPDHPDTLVAV